MAYISEFQDLLTQLRIDESAESDALYEVLGRMPSMSGDWSSVAEDLRGEASSSDEIAGVEAFITNENAQPDAKLDLLTDAHEALKELAAPEATTTTSAEPVDEWTAFYTARKAADPNLTDEQISALFTGGQTDITSVSDPEISSVPAAQPADDWSTFYFAQKAADPNLTDDQIAAAWTEKQSSGKGTAAGKPAGVKLAAIDMEQIPLLAALAGRPASEEGAKAFLKERGADLSLIEQVKSKASKVDQAFMDAEKEFGELDMMAAELEKQIQK